ncbi:MAG: adenylate/guanylate cyclase domain-containing protein, partial [Flavobacteriaceae bacterium]
MHFKRKAYYSLIGFFCVNIHFISGQDQRVVDSLTKIYQQDELEGIEKFEILRNLSFNAVYDFELSLRYANELISLSEQEDNYLYIHRGYLQKGNTNRFAGNLKDALDAFFKGAEAAINGDYVEGEGAAYISIADVYSEMGNTDNADIYYNKGIKLLRKTNDSISLANALLNAGDEYFRIKDFDKALRYFEESGIIYKKVDYLVGTAYNLGNVGMVYAEQGKDTLAEAHINEAIAILEQLEDYYPISIYLTYMSDIYVRKNDFPLAFTYAERSLELATNYGLKDQISEANLKLSQFYEQSGDPVTSYKYYKDHIVYRDSFINLENVQQLADLRTNHEVSQKQTEVDLLNQQKRNQQIILGFSGLLLVSLFWYYRTISREKKRSEALLLNILPAETARELKEKGSVRAKKIASATVLFTDFKGFTSYAEKLSPEDLVETIGFYFSMFDAIIEKHGLEKIKTIGDAYMCAGGLHHKQEDHALQMVKAAFEIAEFVEKTKNDATTKERSFDIRIGINTGPVVAGVVGTKKFAYDIWGDTVNVASRMESMSAPGRINI